MCVCVYVCVRENARVIYSESDVCMCVCVCVREREHAYVCMRVWCYSILLLLTAQEAEKSVVILCSCLFFNVSVVCVIACVRGTAPATPPSCSVEEGVGGGGLGEGLW